MLTSLGALWRARRGRRAAVAAIAPLVKESRIRLHEIPAPIWEEPYMIGFIVMLITLVARQKVRALDTHSMALVQCEAWAEITGVTRELVGEEVLYLSAVSDKGFMQGCCDAVEFSRALQLRPTPAIDDHDAWGLAAEPAFALAAPDCSPDADVERAAVADLWATFFEARVTARRSDAMSPLGREIPIG